MFIYLKKKFMFSFLMRIENNEKNNTKNTQN